jgi:hypothetical protein
MSFDLSQISPGQQTDAGSSAGLSFVLADSVLHRVVQLLQLAMLTGTDVADHLRALRLQPSSRDRRVLEITPACDAAFEAGLLQLKERADELIAQSQASGSSAGSSPLITGR